MRAPEMANDPEAGVMVTAELRVMILFDRCNEQVFLRLNAPGLKRLLPENGLSTVRALPPHP